MKASRRHTAFVALTLAGLAIASAAFFVADEAVRAVAIGTGFGLLGAALATVAVRGKTIRTVSAAIAVGLVTAAAGGWTALTTIRASSPELDPVLAYWSTFSDAPLDEEVVRSGSAKPPTDSELRIASELARRSRTASVRFRDVNNALEDGYFNATRLGVELDHFINLEYMRDGRILDPERPESLMYYHLGDGRLALVGYMYMMEGPGERGPRIGGELTPWHLHAGICQTSEGIPLSGPDVVGCPPGTGLTDTPEMLHVWLIPNATSVFMEHMTITEVDPGLEAHAIRPRI